MPSDDLARRLASALESGPTREIAAEIARLNRLVASVPMVKYAYVHARDASDGTVDVRLPATASVLQGYTVAEGIRAVGPLPNAGETAVLLDSGHGRLICLGALRGASKPWDLPWGEVARAETNTSQTGIGAITDLTGLSVTITPVTGRRYLVRGHIGVVKNATAGDVILRISDNSGERFRARKTLAASALDNMFVEKEFTDGTSFFKLALQAAAGTVDANVHNGTGTHFISVVDVGAA